MGDNQAQKGRTGSQARQDLHPPDQGNHHGRQGRRRSGEEPAIAHRRVCGQGLMRRNGRKPGTMFWSCSGYPTCLQKYPDLKGQPQF